MRKNVIKLVIIVLVIAIGAYAALFGFHFKLFSWDIRYPNALNEEYGIRQGLDLTGGHAITYEAQSESVTNEEMETVKNVLSERLDVLGYTDATISRQGDKKIRVELPPVNDLEATAKKISQTAKLTFRDADGNVVMDASDVKGATAEYGPVSSSGASEHYITLTFNTTGVSKFAAATGAAAARTSEKKNYISIMIDEEEISRPSVEKAINSDSCIISGGFTSAQQTNELVSFINNGSLPVSLKTISQNDIDPTLGEGAVAKSILSLAIGLLLIMIFMIILFKLPGVMADISLLFFVAVLAYLLSVVRAYLSLFAIAGLVLAVGIAALLNIIILTRFKEELLNSKPVRAAVVVGFKKALPTIIDIGVTALLASVALYFFGSGSLKDFSTTLAAGAIVSVLSSVLVTRLTLILMSGLNVKNTKLYGVKAKEDKNA